MGQKRKINAKDLLSILNRTTKKTSPVFSWYSFDPTNLISVELRIVALRPLRQEISFSPLPGSLPYLKQMISGFGKMYFYIPDSSLVFTADFKKLGEDGRLTTGLPEASAYHDRRESGRVIPTDPAWVLFELNGRKHRRRCFDIGLGGLSLIFATNERVKFEEDQVIKGIEIIYNQEVVGLTGVVTEIVKLAPYEIEECPFHGKRISIKFVRIGAKQKEFLEKMIKNHSALIKNLV